MRAPWLPPSTNTRRRSPRRASRRSRRRIARHRTRAHGIADDLGPTPGGKRPEKPRTRALRNVRASDSSCPQRRSARESASGRRASHAAMPPGPGDEAAEPEHGRRSAAPQRRERLHDRTRDPKRRAEPSPAGRGRARRRSISIRSRYRAAGTSRGFRDRDACRAILRSCCRARRTSATASPGNTCPPVPPAMIMIGPFAHRTCPRCSRRF